MYDTEPHKCVGCRATSNFVVNADGMAVCTECGLVDAKYIPLCDEPEWDKEKGTKIINDAMSTKGRYKPIFHWNERINQLCLNLPQMEPDVWERIEDEALTGKYGTDGVLMPHDIVSILRNLGLMKYRERWKWILWSLGKWMVRPPPMITPSSEMLDHLEIMYKSVEAQFWMKKHKMPKSLIRKNGKAVFRGRHNVLPFNYLFRKLMEVFDCREFHWELPLLRSSVKLHALDDIAQEIFADHGIPFSRTAVFKWPKIKKRRYQTNN